MLASAPAPDCTITLKPSFSSRGTTSGTVATRFSPGNTSRGTPITCAMFPPKGFSRILLVLGYSFGRRPDYRQQTGGSPMKRFVSTLVAVVAAFGLATAGAQDKKTTRISISTGGTGGVYYPLGGGLAAMISK